MTDAIEDMSAAAILARSDALGVRIADLRARSDRHRGQQPTRRATTLSGRRHWARWEQERAEIEAAGQQCQAELAQLKQLYLGALSRDPTTRARPVMFACRHCGQAMHVTQGDILDGAAVECPGCGMKATLEPVVSRDDKGERANAMD